MRVGEIRVKRIRVNQGLGVYDTLRVFSDAHAKYIKWAIFDRSLVALSGDFRVQFAQI